MLTGKGPQNNIYFEPTDPATLRVDVQYQDDTTETTTYLTYDLDTYDRVQNESDPNFLQGLKDGTIKFSQKSQAPGKACGESFVTDIKGVFQK